MARDLVERDDRSAEFLRQSEEQLRMPLRRLMLEGPEAALQATEHAQPAITFHCLALLRHLTDAGVAPAAVAGHSLGEFAGLVAAGGLDPADAMLAVQARGQAMSATAPASTGMAAVLGLSDEAVEEACRLSGGQVVPANYNAPGQVVISGTDVALDSLTVSLERAGAKRVIRLAVSAAFHSPLMRQAALTFAGTWSRIDLRPLGRDQVFNTDAELHREPSDIRDLMVRQLTGPVRWSASVLRLARLGVDTFVEVGPKRTLTALVKKIIPTATVHNVEDLKTLDAFLKVAHAA
ncbi:MAG: ACP S-malonyltransferase [Chloroflexi bacterium]|nr:MAG: ACP S-malonyltransferase [Chloroflexota bacterium]